MLSERQVKSLTSLVEMTADLEAEIKQSESLRTWFERAAYHHAHEAEQMRQHVRVCEEQLRAERTRVEYLEGRCKKMEFMIEQGLDWVDMHPDGADGGEPCHFTTPLRHAEAGVEAARPFVEFYRSHSQSSEAEAWLKRYPTPKHLVSEQVEADE